MTRQHFVALAEVIKQDEAIAKSLNQAFTLGTKASKKLNSDVCMELLVIKDAAYRNLANTLASFCQSQNAQFDRDRFLAACGVK